LRDRALDLAGLDRVKALFQAIATIGPFEQGRMRANSVLAEGVSADIH
jgi:hypothetical protein